ncbi:phenoloxidase 1 [Colletes gigas]|uniref:phenoloxidase 1 n=1 Tax=Colletes gigas TaxID=935657 RepID=UPI001C9B6E0D|nr:phenoloxidase 1 [Colletes gigas]
MSNNNSNILHLFDRPTEPIYVPRGDEKIGFDIPVDYLPENYRYVATSIFNRFGEEATKKIQVKQITLPDLSVPMQLGRYAPFSIFVPFHRKLAGHLIDIFMGMRTFDDFLSVAVYCHDRLNANLFIYALSVAILHRPDTKDLPLPPLCEVFPDKYVDGVIFSRIREVANVVPTGSRIPIDIPRDYTASDLDPEHRVAYWREDVGINLHHWHWHLVYPSNVENNLGIVNKDRRGELFYYMHQQIMARYNCERLCNKLGRVKRFIDWHEPIPEAYFPKLDSIVAGRKWPARSGGSVLKDIDRAAEKLRFDIQDLERWRDRIYASIHAASIVTPNGKTKPLTEKDGIDILGNIVEASSLSPNSNVYGDLHNLGHTAISYCHDPDARYLEWAGVMGDSATAMRDPIFYRWHAFVDGIFQEYKTTLPQYTNEQLDFPGIEIADIRLTSNSQRNVLNTFWNQSVVDLSRGLDFMPRGSVPIRFTHLNHGDFTYTIIVNNRNNALRRGTVRIFIAPKEDERGLPFLYNQQRHLMIEMDKFTVSLNPGRNTIERKSMDSSVALPYESTFRNLDMNRPSGVNALEQFNFCGCGWPQHMLVPRGSKEGFPMVLFVMISNYNNDVVEQDEPSSTCRDAVSYCGLKDRKYPDARPMGFPFDRRPRDSVETLAEFLTGNMAITELSIKFTDTILPRSKRGSIGNIVAST